MPYPALIATHAGAWRLRGAARDDTAPALLPGLEAESVAADVEVLGPAEARRALGATPHLLLNAPLVAAHLGGGEVSGLDLLELFAFVAPAEFVVPSVAGLAGWLGLPVPEGPAADVAALPVMADALLARVADPAWPARDGAGQSLARLARLDWPWAPVVAPLVARRTPGGDPGGWGEKPLFEALPEWEEAGPRPPPLPARLDAGMVGDALRRLAGPARPPRPAQDELAGEMLYAFTPRESDDGPNMVVAEAGTGIGKTLAYLAPASLYAQKTGGVVWLSTFTRALQRQLRAETGRSLPDMVEKGEVVVRKGRENYLCLLNLEDALEGGFKGRAAIFAALVARWARYTRDGDMVGGDLPGWLPGLFRRAGGALPALTDRRGECIHAACPHYRRCFIEKSVRDGRRASLVIANHALVLSHAVMAGPQSEDFARLVFDEGHHLGAAADSAFALVFSGAETLELRRWLLGPEGRARRRAGRRRGLAARLAEITAEDGRAEEALAAVVEAAGTLPGTGWLRRIGLAEAGENTAIEQLFALVRRAILARAREADRGYTLELSVTEPVEGLAAAARVAGAALAVLAAAMARLAERLSALADEAPRWLDPYAEARADAARQGLERRVDLVRAWKKLLGVVADGMDGGLPAGGEPPRFVDWLQLVRAEGREVDCGVWRHWLDPMEPLAELVLTPADGVVVTSATLGDPPEAAAGAGHLAVAPHVVRFKSPFPYRDNTRVFIVNDVNPRRAASAALAYARLIEAAGGGTLGLFTSIARLREVHARIAKRLEGAGLPLFAQHVDQMDTGTLVDLFRADSKASLLGTDALRDGVDVPGESLRLIVFEGVPWSRPTILHGHRREAFGGAAYEERLVKGRLAQAFGRLVRSAHDRGCFVLLGAAVPSRLLDAFPDGVEVRRAPLADIVEKVHGFLGRGFPEGETG